MRRVFDYELKQAADAAQAAEAKAQEAACQMKQAEQDTAAAQQQVAGGVPLQVRQHGLAAAV